MLHGIIDTELQQYFEKQKNTPYQNDGVFTINISNAKDVVNNFNISFSGQTDTVNSNFIQDINLNYSDNVTFPISFKKVGNTIGLQTKHVGNKYIAIETDKTQNDALTSLNETVEGVEKITQSPFSLEELNQLQENYINVIKNELQESQFSKDNGYKLTINGEQLKNILVKLLENLKDDQKTLDKINEYLSVQENSAKLTASNIDNYKKTIEQELGGNNETYEITVFQQDGKTNKLEISSQEIIITIEKKKEGDSLQYKISLIGNEEETSSNEISFSANYTGLSGLQSVDEEYTFEITLDPSQNKDILQKAQEAKNSTMLAEEKETIQLLVSEVMASNLADNNENTITVEKLKSAQENDNLDTYKNLEFEQEDDVIVITFTDTKDVFEINDKGKITKEPEDTLEDTSNYTTEPITAKYQFNNQIEFIESADIEEFSDSNAMILNNYEEEQVTNFLEQVEERIQKVNKQQMEEIGLSENENPIIQLFTPLLGGMIYNQASDVISNTSLSEAEINAFNSRFENYESTNLHGTTVRGLLSTIQTNNAGQENNNKKIKEIHFNGEEYEVTDQNISALKDSVELGTAYRVEFEKDENTGIIYRAVINKK